MHIALAVQRTSGIPTIGSGILRIWTCAHFFHIHTFCANCERKASYGWFSGFPSRRKEPFCREVRCIVAVKVYPSWLSRFKSAVHFSDCAPIVRQLIFRTICIMTRYQDDLESLARRSKIDFTQTTANATCSEGRRL